MKLQRYPDGAMHWSLTIWGRHPKKSLTWTHHLALTRYRASSGVPKRPVVIRPISTSQRQYGMMLFRLQLTLTRQDAMIPTRIPTSNPAGTPDKEWDPFRNVAVDPAPTPRRSRNGASPPMLRTDAPPPSDK